MNLIIVESPTKAKTLGRFLGNKWVVDSTMGHIRDLPKSKIGIDVEKDFEPEYVPVAGKADVVARLKKEIQKAEKIYLATDPDREGEAIAWHTLHALREGAKAKFPTSKFVRVTFHEITQDAVQHAIETPREINMQLVDAQQARRVLDRLVGYKLSPLLWKKVRIGLSAGRVQSVAVRLIVEKEREIEAFKPVEYWEIGAILKAENEKVDPFLVSLLKIGDNKAEVKNKEQADKIVADLNKATYKVGLINRREVVKRPYPPFTTSTMAQAAARTFGWSSKKTMSVAQRLYEEGLITYHRTDSLNLNIQAVNSARAFIQKQYSEKYIPEKPRFYKTTSKSAQEAHEAIRPTNVSIQNAEIKSQMGRDTDLLYNLIWRRFVACQMADAIFDETRIDVEAYVGASHAYTLRVSGQIMKFDGWRSLFKKDEEAIQLPEVVEGEALQLVKVDAQQKFTEPPPRYNEASLVKTLEKLGIGRPSTYAPTISTIQERQYVEKTDGKFFPTALGIAVNDFLVDHFPNIVDYNFTAKMEDELDEIAQGDKKWVPVLREFWKPFSKEVTTADKKAERVKVEVEKTGNKCPVCREGDEVIRVGRFGKFLSCSKFPDCKYTAPFAQTLNMKCPDCQKGDVIIRKTKRGKKFFGCSEYPKCKWASWRKPDIPGQKAEETPTEAA